MVPMWVKTAAALMFAIAAGPALAAPVTLTGDVTYRERMALPEGGTLRVLLLDMTAPGTPARVAAEAAVGPPGQVPLTFSLGFDDTAIDTTHSYALVAEISVGKELWFRNAEPYEVAPLAPAAPILIVANFVGGSRSAEPAVSPELVDVIWRAETIRGVPTEAQTESTLSIASDLRAGGKGGCNNYFAQAKVSGTSLAFSSVAATMMACASTIKTIQEESFFEALSAVRSWQLTGGKLVLLDADGTEVLRFAQAAR